MHSEESSRFTPDWVSPPGDTITDIADERGWTTAELAERLGLPAELVSQLLDGKALITEDIALRLEHVLAGAASFWLTREAQHRAQSAQPPVARHRRNRRDSFVH